MSSLSIVIPVDGVPADFKSFLNRLLKSVAPLNGSEIIVVDGSVGTDISKVCRTHGVSVLRFRGSRSVLRSKGAAEARGDYLLFIDAETSLPAEFADVWRMIRRNGRVWGFFTLRFRNAPLSLRWLAKVISLRSTIFQTAVEEQGLFVQRNAWRLVIDSDHQETSDYRTLCRRLGALTPPCIPSQPVVNAAERLCGLGWSQVLRAGLSPRLGLQSAALDAKKYASKLSSSGQRKRTPELP